MVCLQVLDGHFYIFDTQAEAETAQNQIFQGYVALGFRDIHPSTGQIADPQVTTSWAIPQERIDGKWIIPCSTLVTYPGGVVEVDDGSWEFVTQEPGE